MTRKILGESIFFVYLTAVSRIFREMKRWSNGEHWTYHFWRFFPRPCEIGTGQDKPPSKYTTTNVLLFRLELTSNWSNLLLKLSHSEMLWISQCFFFSWWNGRNCVPYGNKFVQYGRILLFIWRNIVPFATKSNLTCFDLFMFMFL